MVVKKLELGVNVDHVATLRQARGTSYPSPLDAALVAESAGADAITIHLREDRRHIQDNDVHIIKEQIKCRLNLEMAVTDEMIDIARFVCPSDCCLVPERREELTTEGGLDVKSNLEKVRSACENLAAVGTRVSLFIDPEIEQIDAAVSCGAPVIELHTGQYAEAMTGQVKQELRRIQEAAVYARDQGLMVNAGHGLTIDNVDQIAALRELSELNIGHSIIARAVFIGLESAVKEMIDAISDARTSALA